MATVRHAGREIISTVEGGWVFAPGATGNRGQTVAFARSNALKVRMLATPGCVHRLTVDFSGTQSQCRDFVDRIHDLYDYRVGTLDVDNFGTFQSCVFLGNPSFSDVIALANNRYLITATMEIQQLI